MQDNAVAAMPAIPSAALGELLSSSPRKSADLLRLLWQSGVAITGPIAAGFADRFSLDTLAAARCAALAVDTDPVFVDRLIRSARPVADPKDRGALGPAAMRALGRAPTMRWITANAGAVAAEPGWREMLRVLGGVTVSVPLAEEALYNVVSAGRNLPVELTASIQLNPWYSGRFVARYRRRMRGKRIRIRDRAATSRGWSHARTIVNDQLPEHWRSLHGRGVGRPLDRWSRRLLNDYVELMLMTFSDGGVPAVLAPLFAVAAAASPDILVPESAAAAWTSLPYDDESVARRLVRLDARIIERSELREIEAIRGAVATPGDDATHIVAGLQALLA